ncbi:hypothetical protein ANANG_G00274270 [Anguilla anguilla]|uniref:Uncharacterized protein n=1 Tax=Anguilla anguilla TaxID=7936 RepID=A0A9D3LLM2_ANGAN|nr:hypothetical protein ANANG_G00274270 [Anguilla anguilla]
MKFEVRKVGVMQFQHRVDLKNMRFLILSLAVCFLLTSEVHAGGKSHSGPCGGRDCSGACKCFPEKGSRDLCRNMNCDIMRHVQPMALVLSASCSEKS